MKKRTKIISIVLLSLLVVGIATASLLQYYGVIKSITTVTQSVLVDGLDTVGGSLSLNDDGGIHTLVNNANVDAIIKLETDCTALIGIDDCEGITTTYVGVLELTTKDTQTWAPTLTKKATIIYTLVGDTFAFTGVPEGYTLIYYKDTVIGLEGRIANPQPAMIVTPTIGNLPQDNDANLDADYSQAPDNYLHKTGAKLWAVPIGALTGTTLDWSQWDSFLYETDLMSYSTNSLGEITLPANGGGVNFRIINDFDVALIPDTYTITTNVIPITE